MKADVFVLGAGMVGVSAALHLQARGCDVVLVDRAGTAATETSYGNSGLIERASYYQYVFPRDLPTLVKTVFGQNRAARIVWRDLPWTASFIARYFHASAPARAAAHARASWPLIENSLREHDALATAAGADALLRRDGWIKAFRSAKTFATGVADAEKVRALGMTVDKLDASALRAREPHLTGPVGAVHYRDPVSCIDPGALGRAYASLFVTRGGRIVGADARTLARAGSGWRVETRIGTVDASMALVAMGPWSDDIYRPLRIMVPMGVKRGYHMHYAPVEGATLNHPVLDADGGYLLAPMRAGVRLTTGAEFARRDHPSTPLQIEWCEPLARRTVPLGTRLDARPWLGARPCLPDLLPVIGPALGNPGLWFDFGHQHHGFTLGPVTGRLVAEMMTGATPFTDPAPFRADRF